jgi:hypothetical protein
MQETEFPYLVYQQQYGDLLKEFAVALGTLAEANDEEGITWLVDHVAILVQAATEQMADPSEGGGDTGGSALPV